MTVQVENLHFAYHRDRPVLNGVTFQAEEGRLVALLGPNGSGKTTLLKTINRLLVPDKGRVLINSVDIGSLSRKQIASRVGYMPQNQAAVPCTVFEAVLLGRQARNAETPNRDDFDKVEEILELVQLGKLAMRSTRELSGGEFQKVILGRALAQEPMILLLDEPINHLDPVNQIEIMSLLSDLTGRLGITSLLVTHDLNNAMRFADHFVMLKDGHVAVQGGRKILTPESIKTVYGMETIMETVAGIPILVPLPNSQPRAVTAVRSARANFKTHVLKEIRIQESEFRIRTRRW